MRVKYIGTTDDQVRWGGNDDPRGILVEGNEYEVLKEEVHTWHTKIYLQDFPALKFNSVCFDVCNDLKPVDPALLKPFVDQRKIDIEQHGKELNAKRWERGEIVKAQGSDEPAQSQLVRDGFPTFYISKDRPLTPITHRMNELDIAVWCKTGDDALNIMRLLTAANEELAKREGEIAELKEISANKTGWQANYEKLLYAVVRKFPDESRFETALRYIQEAESAEVAQPQAKAMGDDA